MTGPFDLLEGQNADAFSAMPGLTEPRGQAGHDSLFCVPVAEIGGSLTGGFKAADASAIRQACGPTTRFHPAHSISGHQLISTG